MLLAMAEIVFEMIAAIFEDIVVFVLDLPAGAPHPPEGVDRGGRQRVVGDEGVVVEDFSRLLMADGQFQPVDQQGVFPIAERNLADKAILPEFAMLAVPAAN